MSFLYIAILLVFFIRVNGDECGYEDRWFVGETQYERYWLYQSEYHQYESVYIRTICKTGYYPSSTDVVRCISGRTDKPLPRCLKVNGDPCLTRERWRVGDTEYIPANYRGEVYVYTKCLKEGYAPNIIEPTKCLGDTTDKPLPQCKKVIDKCPILPAPVHGSKMCDVNAPAVDSSCRFQCNKAYYLRGSEIRICAANLKWSGETPWCVLRPECPVPPPLLNGKVNGCSRFKKPLYEDSCSFVCNRGFELFGPQKLICRRSGHLADISGREDYPQCRDIDECKTNIDHCQHICTNKHGSYECSCRPGYRLIDRHHCEATQESNTPPQYYPYGEPRFHHGNPYTTRIPKSRISCKRNNGGCSQVCKTEEGTAKCECFDGYELDFDGKNCKRIGSFVPIVPDVPQMPDQKRNGHRGTGFIPPVGRSCSRGNGGCHHLCEEHGVTVTCSCRNGFRLNGDGKRCFDIDECIADNFGCSYRCINTLGGAFCVCPSGYKRHEDGKTCEGVDLFVPIIPDVPQMPDEKRNGHRDTGVIPPIGRSCSRGNGGCHHLCEEDGVTVTCSCRNGFRLNGDEKRCSDIDECIVDNFGCSYRCFNTLGGAFCTCPSGYKLQEDGKTCEDIDECSDIILNSCEQICQNTEGSFNCSCRDGYISHKEFKCQACRYNSYRSTRDILCLECPPNSYTKADAQTSIGDCHCSPGFVGDLSRTIPCEDVNECLSDNFGCSHECVNTPGSASCLCPSGFELHADRKTCQDINECNINNGGCQGICHNTEGDFRCSCSKGYTVSDTDRYSCSDVDECLDQNGHCSDLCVNFPGSYHCSCPEGYHLDREGRSCIAIRCPKFLIPLHSSVRCFDKSDVTNKTVFKPGELQDSMEFPGGTQCRVVCGKGYETDESVRTIECQTNGKWNATLPECEVLQCPPLAAPEHGDIDPPECQTQSMPIGTRCYFTCHPDYRIAGQQAIVCSRNLTWTVNQHPSCVPIKVVPFISCPEDVTVALHDNNESNVTLTLPPPTTNMEESQVHPQWVVVGVPTIFPAGRTDVTYSVNTWKNKTLKCEMSVTVSDQVPPVFDYCPDSFDVDGDVFGVQVYYDEPIASDNVGISSILKSMEPNATLLPGIHVITYVARDFAGNAAKCSFNISVSRGAECIDLADPQNGEANCMDWMFGKICEPICNVNYTLSLNDTNIFMCDDSGTWRPSDIIPPCLPECSFDEVWSSQFQRCEEKTAHIVSNISSA